MHTLYKHTKRDASRRFIIRDVVLLIENLFIDFTKKNPKNYIRRIFQLSVDISYECN